MQFIINTHFKWEKHFYFKQFRLLNKVKLLEVLLFKRNNLVKPQTFIYT